MRIANSLIKCFICNKKLIDTSYACEECWNLDKKYFNKLAESIPDYIPVKQEYLYLKTSYEKRRKNEIT